MKGLTNNQLKLFALVTMTADHVGVSLFPQLLWLRIVGRLAFPIFAYMIAEGCTHTRSMGKYFGTMALLALGCQLVDYFARDSLYQSILVTFSLSIGLIWLMETARKTGKPVWAVLGIVAVLGIYVLCEVLPGILPKDFNVDYGLIGVLVPVAVYMGRNKQERIVNLLLMLVLLSVASTSVQWYCLLAVIPVLFYNGQRGKWKMKWLFYFYYPAHLVAIYGISFLL